MSVEAVSTANERPHNRATGESYPFGLRYEGMHCEVQILDNELVFSAEQWDVEFEARRLTVRHASRDIFVSIKFDPPGRVVLDRAHIWRNTIAGMVAMRCQVGLAVGDPPQGLGGAIFMGSMRAPHTPHPATEARVVKIAIERPDDDHEALIGDFTSFLEDVSPDDFAV